MSQTYTLSGNVYRDGESIILVCDEYPISGIGWTQDAATQSLIRSFLTYLAASQMVENPAIHSIGLDIRHLPEVNLEYEPQESFRLDYAPMAAR